METAKPSLSPTLKQIWQYTHRVVPNRYDYFKRDILPSKIEIITKKVYSKDRPDQFDILLEIRSYSAPQYQPYAKVKSKKAKRQLKIIHNYDVLIQLQLDRKGEYSWDSKIRWRVGSYKKWRENPPKSMLASTPYKDRKSLSKKLKKEGYSEKEARSEVKERVALQRLKAKYLDVGDYNAQVNGLNGDFYFRCMPLSYKYNCLYGPLTHSDPCPDRTIKFPFLGKHEIAVILMLYKRHFLKGSPLLF